MLLDLHILGGFITLILTLTSGLVLLKRHANAYLACYRGLLTLLLFQILSGGALVFTQGARLLPTCLRLGLYLGLTLPIIYKLRERRHAPVYAEAQL